MSVKHNNFDADNKIRKETSFPQNSIQMGSKPMSLQPSVKKAFSSD